MWYSGWHPARETTSGSLLSIHCGLGWSSEGTMLGPLWAESEADLFIHTFFPLYESFVYPGAGPGAGGEGAAGRGRGQYRINSLKERMRALRP